VRSGLHKLRAYLQGINELRTTRRKIEAPNLFRAEFVLHQTSSGGKQHVGSHRRHDDSVQIAGRNSAFGQSFLRRFDRQIAGRNALVHNMTLADTDAAHDPFVIGVNQLFKVGVGEKTGRNVGAESADLNALKLAQ
jgi:hypothetical protein